ncbi:RrF2 family transcriptional regulator [Eisenibacter elegans]|jgi:Rrf2 family protein|uniref:RrF2 family transcriptional regulator n=1 Tax=Eisenibacter elegans TaxID=997 RepID=UPI0003F80937|nr:Rrf2 family transcriptional regulator [Eisenibacter elegans]
MLSKKAKYAIKALLVLADAYGQGPLLISAISEKESMPKKFLEIILLELKNAGILSSKKGKGGGYYLRQSPQEINLAQIIRLVDGPIAPTPCVSLNYYEHCDDCPDEHACRLRQVMIQIRDANLSVLENTNLQDMLNQPDMPLDTNTED